MDQSTIDILRASAPLLVNAGPAVTTRCYENMLKDHPELNNIFNRSHQVSGAQSRALFTSLCDFLRCADDLSEMQPSIERITHKHVAVQIQPEFYPVVIRYLLGAMEEILNPGDEVLSHWEKAIGVFTDILIRREGELSRMTSDPSAGGWKGLRQFKVDKKIIETEDVMSFVLIPVDGRPVFKQKPGQYITLHFPPNDLIGNWKQIRHYSISDSANGVSYRISVKRHDEGLISRHMHDVIRVGDTVLATPPFGSIIYTPLPQPNAQPPLQPVVNFVKRAVHKAKAKMNLKSDQSKIIYSTVFIGSGVGVTCLLPMLISAIEQQEPLLWIQAGENERNMLFASEVKHALMKAQSFAKGVVWYRYATKEDKQQLPEDVESVWKKQRPEDVENAFNEVEKHFGEVQLKYVLPQDENECKMIQRVYLCGSSSFMKEMASQLLKLGLESDRILYETYGPHTVLVPRPIPVLSSIA